LARRARLSVQARARRTTPMIPRLALQGITKRYPGVVANDGVDLEVAPGEIHAVLGENGAGKSTLMKVIYGAVHPDAGTLAWNGKLLSVKSPQQARALGIAMVFQHFSLFDTLTAAQNVWLGLSEAYTLALAITLIAGASLFTVLGKAPLSGLAVFFIEPIKNAYAWSELAVKATPLLLIALGLSLCFRSNVWNIGAEGQFVLGAIGGGWVAMHATEESSKWILVPILLAGIACGALWAWIVALLRDRYNASEILVSLMLVYVAELLLQYLVYGPWKDPAGYNFPQTITFAAATKVPKLVRGLRTDIGVLIALFTAAMSWVFMFRTYAGFQLQVGGLAPAAARYAGFSSRRALWTALGISGGLAGLAGALEAAGPLGQLTPYVPVGYGFAAIIVAFVGRLHPAGAVFASILMSMFYIGGELAQSRLGLPKSLTGVFQGLLLFALLACDSLINYGLIRSTAGSSASHP
jgi:simple sugar transport system permease protein